MDDDSAWRRALAPLREGPSPADRLETRVVSAMTAGRTAARSGRSGFRLAVAALLLLAVGGLLGRWSLPDPPPSPGPRYLLLLYEGARYDSAGASHAGRVEEYRAWGRELGRAGKLVDGAELGSGAALLGGTGESTVAPAGVLAGYFIIQARDPQEAAAIASGCPHLKYGGVVEVRSLRTS